ncbi:metal-dependent transcriptional regulator [Aureibaculum luteum]|uniref:metal-dependent transcriptional regulator n=1 Tax=Aureibaculum luteum TaxID=1548456 RepID=UPI000E4C96A7|nr:DtxR family transcriptional regulator [Aureibaculum luteum]
MNYNPTHALLIFFGLVLISYLLFRPKSGWFWVIKNNLKSNEKIVIEDVLKQLYHIENSGKEMNLHDLNNSLKFNDRTIVDVVKKMTIIELITFDGDNLKLTDSGRDYALRIVRVHRLWEKYLAEKTGFDKVEWHIRAEDMEHKLSHEETDLLATRLGNPQYDPHGDPIPTKLGKVADLEGEFLSSLKVGSVGRIVHIEDEPDVIYKQILAEKIHIGSQIRVIENNKERVVFYAEGQEFVLAPIVAANITITLLEKEESLEENMARLSSLKDNEEASIIGISKESRGDSRRRLLDLGFVRGAKISIDLESPFGNPIAYLIKGTSIALRHDQASKILIKKGIENGK